MKNLLLGLCLVGLTFACKSNDTAKVDDAGNPNLPVAECGSAGDCCATECSDAKAECSAEKAECSSTKAECSGAKSECSTSAPSDCSAAKPECSSSDAAVCPMSGKPIN